MVRQKRPAVAIGVPGRIGRTCGRSFRAGSGVDPDPDGDLIGPGIAIDETAQLKHGDATACVAPQHAECTGQVENCVTTVFSAYVTASGQAWADFDVDQEHERARPTRPPGA